MQKSGFGSVCVEEATEAVTFGGHNHVTVVLVGPHTTVINNHHRLANVYIVE